MTKNIDKDNNIKPSDKDKLANKKIRSENDKTEYEYDNNDFDIDKLESDTKKHGEEEFEDFKFSSILGDDTYIIDAKKIDKGIKNKFFKIYMKNTLMLIGVLIIIISGVNFYLGSMTRQYSNKDNSLYYNLYSYYGITQPEYRLISLDSKPRLFGRYDIKMYITKKDDKYIYPDGGVNNIVNYNIKPTRKDVSIDNIENAPIYNENLGFLYEDKKDMISYIKKIPDSAYLKCAVFMDKPTPYLKLYRELSKSDLDVGWMRILDMKHYDKEMKSITKDEQARKNSNQNDNKEGYIDVMGLDLNVININNLYSDKWTKYFNGGKDIIKDPETMSETDLKNIYLRAIELSEKIYQNNQSLLSQPYHIVSYYKDKNGKKMNLNSSSLYTNAEERLKEYKNDIEKENVIMSDIAVVYGSKDSILKLIEKNGVYGLNILGSKLTKYDI